MRSATNAAAGTFLQPPRIYWKHVELYGLCLTGSTMNLGLALAAGPEAVGSGEGERRDGRGGVRRDRLLNGRLDHATRGRFESVFARNAS